MSTIKGRNMKSKKEHLSITIRGRSIKCALILVAGVVGAIWEAVAAPQLSLPTGGLDFGEIAIGTHVVREGTVANRGDRPLQLGEIEACCGATARWLDGAAPFRLEPGATARFEVGLSTDLPVEFAKSVAFMSNDPLSPRAVMSVFGRGVEIPSKHTRFTLGTLIVSGFIDGFNPCAFTIVIILAGILAAGGSHRTARLVGGISFCVGSYLTYMLMGLGFLGAWRSLATLSRWHDWIMGALATMLVVLGFLSLRDAWRYRRTGDFRTVTLQLPDRVKKLIRMVATICWNDEADAGRGSWRISLVLVTSFGCGFIVTLLDALCTGQIYVPACALIAREPEAVRTFLMLALYNLAFIAPLITIFIVAALGVDSSRLQGWSRRNVVPSKIGLAFIFLLLAVLIMPGVGSWIVTMLLGR